MKILEQGGPSRRDVIRTAAAAGAAASVGPFFHVRPARAAGTLKILQWSHFVPAYDEWFNGTYVKEWGAANDTEVVVDNINLGLIPSRAAAEVSAQQGHDLIMFLSPPSVYEEQTVDMKDVYAECESRHGKPIDLAIKSTFNPKTVSSARAHWMLRSSSNRAVSSTSTVTCLFRSAAFWRLRMIGEPTLVRYNVCLIASTSGSVAAR